jgi:hypothetical protein
MWRRLCAREACRRCKPDDEPLPLVHETARAELQMETVVGIGPVNRSLAWFGRRPENPAMTFPRISSRFFHRAAGLMAFTSALTLAACSSHPLRPDTSSDGSTGRDSGGTAADTNGTPPSDMADATIGTAADLPIGDGPATDSAPTDAGTGDMAPTDGGPPPDSVTPDGIAPVDGGPPTDLGPPPDVGVSCTMPEMAAAWATMDQAPIMVPNRAAALDLAGPNGQGLTLHDAETVNCNGTNLGDAFGNGEEVISWGDNAEVWFEFKTSTEVGDMLTLWPGYVGTVDFHDSNSSHTYQIGLATQIAKDGAPFELNGPWSVSDPVFAGQLDELTRALLATFAPTVTPDPPGTTCLASNKCMVGHFGDVGYAFIPALGFAFWVDNVNAAQPSPSVPSRIDMLVVAPN